MPSLKRAAVIHTGPTPYLDHLAPLAHLLDIPLIVTDPIQHALALELYPQTHSLYLTPADLSLFYLADHFDLLFQTGHLWAIELLPLFELFCGKKMRIVYCPHGHSDKRHSTRQKIPKDLVLVYGSEMLRQVKAQEEIRGYATIGNYRRAFYEAHKTFYDNLIAEKLPLDPTRKTLLYAPTWSDQENTSSFFSSCSELIEELAPTFNLVVKLHPFLERDHPAKTQAILTRYENQKGVHLLTDFPLIYPLLNRVDAYVGDYSSIGYDFLAFDKPLFFLGERKGFLIDECGYEWSQLRAQWDQKHLSEKRKEVYDKVFAEMPTDLGETVLSSIA